MKRNGPNPGKSAFELIDEAFWMLRSHPSLLISYYTGAFPFFLGLLYFWTDMSKSAFAHQHLGSASLGMACLFVWMRIWQSVFAVSVRYRFGRQTEPRWTVSRLGRVMVSQTIIRTTEIFVLPVSLIFFIPFGWCYAFYQNATCLDTGEDTGLKSLVSSAIEQARPWPRQNHILLILLSLFGLFVFLNTVALLAGLPALFKTLFGIETIFTMSGYHFWTNSTFWAIAFTLTHLFMDPLMKTIYAIRCFYVTAIGSGEDLQAQLREHHIPQKASFQKCVPVLMVLLSLFIFPPHVRGRLTRVPGAVGFCRRP